MGRAPQQAITEAVVDKQKAIKQAADAVMHCATSGFTPAADKAMEEAVQRAIAAGATYADIADYNAARRTTPSTTP
ncbi:hypothetical protein SMF913_13053 [Streptomyces malaysiensis]|uniref:Uncharacterized protein n=1 Tax=Streptomyces malaysiensis TaxID=92644 RepID=A0A2J7Z9S0_STRMQ|nr:hypothetical protein SMF913_13053 [Streptomyces malaysiensis]